MALKNLDPETRYYGRDIGEATETFDTVKTSTQTTTILDARGWDEITIWYTNRTDVDADIQVQAAASRDAPDDEWEDINSVMTVSSGSSDPTVDHDELDAELPWIRIQVTASGGSDSTSGDFEVKAHVEG